MTSTWKKWKKRIVSESSSNSSVCSSPGADTSSHVSLPASVRGPLMERIYYHGLLCREDVEHMLVSEGDFILRTTDVCNRTVLVVSVRLGDGQLKHIVIEQHPQSGLWLVQNDRMFSSPEDLIDFYHATGQPLDGPLGTVRLVNGVPKQKWELRADQIQIRGRLGSGAFGEVHSAVLLVDERRYHQCAVKTVNNPGFMSKAQREEFLREARLMRNYEHARVVRLYGVVAEPDKPLMVVMELATGGNLLNWLRQPHNWTASAKERVRFAIEAAEGMRYLEKQNCVHRDLAARNCLLDAECHVKISDFGLSIESETGRTEEATSGMRIAVKWQAPEVLAERRFTTKSDVWAFGVLLYEIFSNGREPYPGVRVEDARVSITIGQLKPQPPPANMDGAGAPPPTPDGIAKIMDDCTHAIAEQRPNFLKIKLTLRKVAKKLE